MDIAAAFAELELDPGADAARIKAAWRRLVSRWHPDRYAGADGTQRIQRINSAYDLLQSLASMPPPSPPPRPEASARPRPAAREEAPRRRQRASSAAGADARSRDHEQAQGATATPTIRRKLRIRWADVALGLSTTLQGHITLDCRACSSRGWWQTGSPCTGCEGQGQIQRPTLFPWLGARAEDCEACGGSGAGRAPCTPCKSTGRRRVAYRQAVRLPEGLRGGQVWSAPLQLDDGRTGCIDIELELEGDPQLSLDEHGVLHAQVEVCGWAWVGERWTEVPTATGTQQMRLRRAHRRYRLAGQGVPAEPGSPRGDLIVHVQPVFPETLDAESEALIDRLIARASFAPGGAGKAADDIDDTPPGRPRHGPGQGTTRRRRGGESTSGRARGEP